MSSSKTTSCGPLPSYCRAVLTALWRSRRPSVADLLVAAGFVALGQLVT